VTRLETVAEAQYDGTGNSTRGTAMDTGGDNYLTGAKPGANGGKGGKTGRRYKGRAANTGLHTRL